MYKFKDGFHVPEGITAEMVNNELERIRGKYGAITSTLIVEESRDPRAVLHKCFTWNDEQAAEYYRRQEASRLIRSVVLTKWEKQEETTVFVLTKKDDQRQYVPIFEVQRDPEMLEYSIKLLNSHLRGVERTISDLLKKPLSKKAKARAEQMQKHISKALELGAGL